MGEKVDPAVSAGFKRPRLDRRARPIESRIALPTNFAHRARPARLDGLDDVDLVAIDVNGDQATASGAERDANTNGSRGPVLDL
jgi:hypothetical protein